MSEFTIWETKGMPTIFCDKLRSSYLPILVGTTSLPAVTENCDITLGSLPWSTFYASLVCQKSWHLKLSCKTECISAYNGTTCIVRNHYGNEAYVSIFSCLKF